MQEYNNLLPEIKKLNWYNGQDRILADKLLKEYKQKIKDVLEKSRTNCSVPYISFEYLEWIEKELGL